MYTKSKRLIFLLMLLTIFIFSCRDLEEMNINPNGVDPAIAHPNLLLSTLVTSTGQAVVSLGYGNIAGVMQHTQKDGWSGGHNGYDWTTSQDWGGYYSILRNVDEMYNKAVDMELEFHQGVALVIKSYIFGLITDLWGDAPYSQALKGDLGEEKIIQPVFDSQEDIYAGILADLETANTLLSGNQSDYDGISPVQDILLEGDVERWRKFANSLALRYYMRLSEKDPSNAQAGIENIVGDPEGYPIILDASDDVNMDYPGASTADSWPTNTVFGQLEQGSFRRLKMCATLVDTMQNLNDPRLELWAQKVDIPLVVVASPADRDEIVNGIRYVGPDAVNEYFVLYGLAPDEDPEYVGLPPSWGQVPQAYNMNPDNNWGQAPRNPHASHLNDRYKNASGPLLKSRVLTAAEVHFIIAEAALNGWTTENPLTHYEAGVQASLKAWGISSKYDDYMLNAGVAYEGTLEQIMEQKWIASWTAAAEAWFDYRRTGLPALQPGTVVKRDALPLRFYYSVDEMNYNPENSQVAIDILEETAFSAEDGKNSAWSKMWVLQGTGKPW
ncbi:MAG: SusD/RagB family nutrient-binding outer membrane lipoprotein [Bacteroidales bacterium]|nr:SusD/RagB family nutrient-binding outer membrane lipoprotein [Bacteroidales bacterium]